MLLHAVTHAHDAAAGCQNLLTALTALVERQQRPEDLELLEEVDSLASRIAARYEQAKDEFAEVKADPLFRAYRNGVHRWPGHPGDPDARAQRYRDRNARASPEEAALAICSWCGDRFDRAAPGPCRERRLDPLDPGSITEPHDDPPYDLADIA